ncbi:MAG: MFS transporter [Proteobacteria bacterium]|nr:MFS transporter [Pseudomonadota bacterium]
MISARQRAAIIAAVGIAQILAWGSSYYLIAVLADPVARDTGWPLSWIVGGLSLGFLVSGLVSPRVGRMIEARGGRGVLAGSAALIAAGLALLGFAPNLPVYVLAWLVLGVGMGAGLYDPAFATLGRLFGEGARSAITQLTLYGGFASTVCWPLSAWLVAHVGWRGACFGYAAINLLVVMPLYLLAVPSAAAGHAPEGAGKAKAHPPPAAAHAAAVPPGGAPYWLLAGVMTLSSVVMTVISVQLITLMLARGASMTAAVALGTLLGPAQVGARVVDMLMAKRHHPVWTLIASTVLVTLGLGLLMVRPDLASAGILLYGAGSGIRSIARGTVPLALFGPQGYAAVMGRLAMPSLIGQAAAPAIGGVLIGHFGPSTTMIVLFAGAAVAIPPAAALLAWTRPPTASAPAG